MSAKRNTFTHAEIPNQSRNFMDKCCINIQEYVGVEEYTRENTVSK
jgi:hypothetical protein